MRRQIFLLASAALVAMAGQAHAQYFPPSGTGVTGITGTYAPPGGGPPYDGRTGTNFDRRTTTTQPTRADDLQQYYRNQGYARGRPNNDAIDSTVDRRYTTPTPGERNDFVNDPSADKRYSPQEPTRVPGGFIDGTADKRYSPTKPPETVPRQPVTANKEDKSTENERETTVKGPPRSATPRGTDDKKRDDKTRQ